MVARRKRNLELFSAIIDEHSNLFYNVDNAYGNSSFCFPFICKTPDIMQRIKSTFTEYGIEYRPVVSGNLLRQPFLVNRGYKLEKGSSNNVDLLHKQGVYIGNNHFINDKDMEYLGNVLRKINAR
jgi:CDP-6-deoxy-D-xylo-4-hexulose-3-dehydrase